MPTAMCSEPSAVVNRWCGAAIQEPPNLPLRFWAAVPQHLPQWRDRANAR